MQRNAWKDIVNWLTKQLNSYAKSQLHNLTTTNSRKKKWDLSEHCQKFAHKLFWNACIWRALVDLIFCGQWTNLLVLSRNGQNSCDKHLARFDFFHSSNVWIQTILSCGKYSTTVQLRIISGLWFCLGCSRFKINIRGDSCAHSGSHTFVPKSWMSKKQTTLFRGSWNIFSWCLSTHGWNSSSWSLGFVLFFPVPIQNCFCFEQDHPELSLQEECQSRGTESPESGPASTRKTDRLHDLRLFSSHWRLWYRSRLRWFTSLSLFVTTMFKTSIRDGTKF